MPLTDKGQDGVAVCIPTLPSELTTKEVVSGFVESSTTKALPEPVWVILNALVELLTDIVAIPDTVRLVTIPEVILAIPVVIKLVVIPVLTYARSIDAVAIVPIPLVVKLVTTPVTILPMLVLAVVKLPVV